MQGSIGEELLLIGARSTLMIRPWAPRGGGPETGPHAREEQRRRWVKRPFQPNNRRRAKRHGFRHRMSTRAGRAIVRARRLKGRTRLSA
jgi:large subunit ribosomal protein L34